MNILDKKDHMSLVPYGLLVTRAWLKSKGLERHTLDNWVKSGKLSSLAKGVLKRADTNKLTWQSVICSLQRMGFNLIVGGVTALEVQGFGHYLPLSQNRTIHLYGRDKLPSWLDEILPEINFIRHNEQQLFGKMEQKIDARDTKTDSPSNNVPLQTFNTSISYGIEEWPLELSTPEKAFFESLLYVPEHLSFEHADQLMEGLINLSPRRLNSLLEKCTNIKVKRLFLWFAKRQNHPWSKKLDWEKFNMEGGTLGSGKRVIVKGGKLDSQYLITVPKEFYGSK